MTEKSETGSADDLPLVGDQHQVVVIGHLLDIHHAAVALGGLDGDDPLAAAALDAVLVELGPLAEAVFGDGEDGRTDGMRR